TWVVPATPNLGVKNSELEFYHEANDAASRFGHVPVMQWWKNSGLPLKYGEEAVCDATKT
ncbi:hypothetical protein DFJ73DRAFT_888704, partial [Zopfochytrium polystomum]